MRAISTVAVVAIQLAATVPAVLHAQQPGPHGGRELYVAACANCHGSDGRGAPDSVVGFADPPRPDFTDCSFASREAAVDWYAVVHQGGTVRAFSRRMPAFGKALSQNQVELVVAYVLEFCQDKSWPRGELNLPRAMATEKAFPEDETVLTAAGTTSSGSREVVSTLIYERRIGSQTQWELAIPFGVRELQPRQWTGLELGDVAVALKRAVFHSGKHGYIVSTGAEVVLPTGRASDGLGAGTTVFEPFVLAAKTLPRDAFIQVHGGAEFPMKSDKAEREIFGRIAFGATFGTEFGRTFSPLVELVAARALEKGARAEQDWIPQMQVSLSRRQHVLASFGARLPISDRRTRPKQLVAYIIWDWFDGGLLDGWR